MRGDDLETVPVTNAVVLVLSLLAALTLSLAVLGAAAILGGGF